MIYITIRHAKRPRGFRKIKIHWTWFNVEKQNVVKINSQSHTHCDLQLQDEC